jgi:hypothetical protein
MWLLQKTGADRLPNESHELGRGSDGELSDFGVSAMIALSCPLLPRPFAKGSALARNKEKQCENRSLLSLIDEKDRRSSAVFLAACLPVLGEARAS